MTNLRGLIAETLGQPVPAEIAAVAGRIRADHGNVLAVLAYGSCLRGVATTESLIDLYLLTGDFHGVSANAISRLGCCLAPPNVYYAECDIDGQHYRAKYAVMPLTQFNAWMGAGNPYFWARFAQPAALVFAADAASRETVIGSIEQAARSMYGHALGLAGTGDSLAQWKAGFRATYRTELRAESGGSRAAHVVDANAGYYQALATALAGTPPIAANWRWKTMTGKLWAVARLIKASLTFAGAADYVVWKIERHTGHRIALSPWQRRHPVIAAMVMLPRLLAAKVVR